MKNFMNGWSIKKRLYFFGALLMCNMLLVAAVAYRGEFKMEADLTEMAEVYVPVMRKLGTIDMMHDGLRGIGYRAMLFGDSAGVEEKKEIRTELQEAALTIKDSIQSARSYKLSSEISVLIDRAAPDVESYVAQVTAVVELGLAGQKDAAFGKAAEMQISFEKLEKSLGALSESFEKEAEGDTKNALMAANQSLIWGEVAIVFGLIVGCFFSWWIVQRVNTSFATIIIQLSKESEDVSGASIQIGGQSQQVSSATHEQASALQETAASIEQITAMVKKTADNSKKLESAAVQSSASAERGKTSVASMIKAIGAIREANDRVLKQVEAGNAKITDIVKVIGEIGNKTKVINDIVFQTKLLSFNASVEAARAGEHGKGFAVVAEEVGNLAQMSGTAAKEISDMLSSSIAHVESIVSETKRGVDGLVVEGRSKVDSGIEVANQAGKSLEEIVGQVSEVSSMVNEITTAIQEQTQGIHEISKAIGQLDAATQMNAKASKDAEVTSAELQGRAASLNEIVFNLKGEVFGKSGAEQETVVSGPTPKVEGYSVRESTVVPFERPSTPVAKRAVGSIAVGGLDVPSEDDPRFSDV